MESKNFSKKSEIILVSLSIFAIFISTLLVIFANQFYTIIYDILSTKVFHREFDFNKWLPSIESFFLIEISSLKNKNPHHIPQKIVTALFALAIESGIDFKTCCHKTAYTNSIKIIAQYRKQKFTDKKSKPDAFFPRTV